MNNIYKDFFDLLKIYLDELEIDKNEYEISGCTEEEIKKIEKKHGNIPLAYREYLKSIGKDFLFQFMDAEDMSYKNLNHIWNFGKEVFKNNKTKIEKQNIVISERRNECISFIYLNEDDDPKVWIISKYWNDKDDDENLTVRANSFTELILYFFSQTLRNQTYGFHFVNSEEKSKNNVKDKYIKWAKGLAKIKELTTNYNGDNKLIINLNDLFLNYYDNNQKNINSMLKNNNNILKRILHFSNRHL
jgi:hypothetical protein